MKKAQIITLSACVLGGIALLAAGWVLLRGVLRFNEAAGALNDAKQQLTGYYREAVFPSAENVQREQANTAQIRTWFDGLMATLREGNVIRTERSPSQFKSVLEKAQERLWREARAAGTELPAGFAFGFDRYTASGTLPRPDDVPRLTEQLILVTRICKILFDHRVKEVRVLERALFEEEAAAVTAAGPSVSPAMSGRRTAAGGGRGPSSAREVRSSGMPPGLIPDGGLFGKYRFVLEFNAKEAALVNILNALASSPVFTVVNVVRIAKDVPPLMPTVAEPPVTPPAAGGAPSTPMHLGPNYPVSGLEMEIPMRVRFELDIFKFKGDS